MFFLFTGKQSFKIRSSSEVVFKKALFSVTKSAHFSCGWEAKMQRGKKIAVFKKISTENPKAQAQLGDVNVAALWHQTAQQIAYKTPH